MKRFVFAVRAADMQIAYRLGSFCFHTFGIHAFGLNL
jgi:hypothetical protein